jgi:large subunit ribosomal protein L9
VKLVLRADVDGVGKRGDVVQVADGYGRNYLVPTGKAFLATDGINHQAASMRRARDLRDVKDRQGAEAVATKLVPLVIRIPARAGSEGRLFGSVTGSDIVGAVAGQTGIEIDRRKLLPFEPIKSVGRHEVSVRLHHDVEFRLTLEVAPA